MATLEDEVRANTRKMDELLSAMRGNVRGPFRQQQQDGTSTSVLGDGFKTLLDSVGRGFGNVFDTAGGMLEKSYQNTMGIGDVSQALTKTIGQLGGPFEGISKVMGGLSGVLIDSYQNWQKFSGLGLQMGGDFMALNTAIKRTGMTVEEYGAQWEKIGEAAVNLGKGLSGGVQEFGRVMELTMQPGYAETFKMLGMLPKDVNSAMVTVIRSMDVFARNATAPELLNATMQLAREMDAVAKLTGKSREEQERTIEAAQADVRYQARLEDLRYTNPDAAMNAGEVTKQLKGVDPAVAKLFSEGFGGQGIFSTDAIYRFEEVYGPKGVARITTLTRDMQSDNAQVRQAAFESSKTLMRDLALYSRELNLQTKNIQNGTTENEFVTGRYNPNSSYTNLLKNMDSLIAKGINKEEAYDKALKIADLEGQGRIGQLTPDMEAENARLLAKNPNAVAKYIVGEMNPDNALGRTMQNLDANTQRFNVGLNNVAGELEKTFTRLVDMGPIIAQAAGYSNAIDKKTGKEITSSNVNRTMEAIQIEIKNAGSLPENWTTTIGEAVIKKLKDNGVIRRSGSLGSVGSFFEDFGEGKLAVLHGNEGVFTPDQAEAFATQKFSNIIPNLSSLLRNVETKISSDSPVSSQVMEQLVSGADAAMNLSAEKLDAISNLLAANLKELKDIAQHTANTVTNTSDMGGYVS
jgi:hypothetical protein